MPAPTCLLPVPAVAHIGGADILGLMPAASGQRLPPLFAATATLAWFLQITTAGEPAACAAAAAGDGGSESSSNGASESDDDTWKVDAELSKLIAGLIGERCEIDVSNVWSATTGPVDAQHASVPVIHRQLATGPVWKIAAKRWQRAALLQRYGNVPVEPLLPIEVAQFGPGRGAGGESGAVELVRYLQVMRHEMRGSSDSTASYARRVQLFDRGAGEAVGADRGELPQLFEDLNESALSLGSAGAGLPLHSHGESWLSLVHGRKVWFMLPPDYADAAKESSASSKREIRAEAGSSSADANQGRSEATEKQESALAEAMASWRGSRLFNQTVEDPMLRQLLGWAALASAEDDEKVGPNGQWWVPRPALCIQEPGDVIYLPSGWQHATLNLGEAIGIAGQTNRLRLPTKLPAEESAAALSTTVDVPLRMPAARQSLLTLAASLAATGYATSASAHSEGQVMLDDAEKLMERRLQVLRTLVASAPGQLDSVSRLVSALLEASAAGPPTVSQQKRRQRTHSTQAALSKANNEAALLREEALSVLREARRAIRRLEVGAADLYALQQNDFEATYGNHLTRFSRALRRATLHLCFSKPHMDLSGFAQLRQKVRLCGLWADIPGKAAAAVRCLLKLSSPRKSHSADSVGAAQPKLVAASVDGNHPNSGVSDESAQPAVFAAEEAVALGSDVLLGQSLSIRLTWELARARMLALQEVSARGGDVTASMVELISTGLQDVLRQSPGHQAAQAYLNIVRAPPPAGLGWRE